MIKQAYIFLALSVAALTLPANAAVISLSVLNTPTVGSTFSVAVLATNVFSAPHVGDALAAYGFDVFVTGGSVTFVSSTAGPLFTDISASFAPGSPKVAAIATAGFLVAGDFVEPLRLATLVFQANSTGVATVSLGTNLLDLNQGLIYLGGTDAISASAAVNPASAPVPEPGTLMLTALAGAVLLFVRTHKFDRT